MTRKDKASTLVKSTMTEKSMGFCVGVPYPGYMNPISRRRLEWKRKFWKFYPEQDVELVTVRLNHRLTKKEEKELLEKEIKALHEEKKNLEEDLEPVKKT